MTKSRAVKRIAAFWIAACVIAALCGGADHIFDARISMEGSTRPVLDDLIMVVVALCITAAAVYSGMVSRRAPRALGFIASVIGPVAVLVVLSVCAHDIDGAMALLTMLLIGPLAFIGGALATVDRSTLAQRP